MKKNKELTQRWDPALLKKVNESLESTGDKALGNLVGEYNGRHDLRGFPLSVRLHEKELRNVDFSEGEFKIRSGFNLCKMHNCTFEYVNMDQSIDMIGDFYGCIFSHNKRAFHSLEGEFKECNFINSKLSKTCASSSQFVSCDFSECKAIGIDLGNSKIIECKLINSNFKQAVLLRSEFINCDLQGLMAEGAMYESKNKFTEGTIFRGCKNLDPKIFETRHEICNDLPIVIP